MVFKKFYKTLTLIAFTSVVFSCNSFPQNFQQDQGRIFGTTYGIQYESTQNFKKQIDSLLQKVNSSLSTYIPESLLSKINTGKDLELDIYLKDIFQISDSLYQETNAYFDPTVGNLVNYWGFGSEKASASIDSLEVDSLHQYVGLHQIKIENNRFKKTRQSIYLEFNAIAKGYGLDVIDQYFKSLGLKNYLIEIGGEILARGIHPVKQKQWVAGIEKPVENKIDKSFQKTVKVSGFALASSGNYRKIKLDSNGNKIVHTLNPKTGYPEINNLLGATVLAKTCARADGLATAFMVMGFEKSKIYLKEHPETEAFLIYVAKNNEVVSWSTAYFKKR